MNKQVDKVDSLPKASTSSSIATGSDNALVATTTEKVDFKQVDDAAGTTTGTNAGTTASTTAACIGIAAGDTAACSDIAAGATAADTNQIIKTERVNLSIVKDEPLSSEYSCTDSNGSDADDSDSGDSEDSDGSESAEFSSTDSSDDDSALAALKKKIGLVK